MQDTAAVRMLNRGCELPNERRREVRRNRSTLGKKPLMERPAIAECRRDITDAAHNPHVVDGNNVRVIELARGTGLAQEPLAQMSLLEHV